MRLIRDVTMCCLVFIAAAGLTVSQASEGADRKSDRTPLGADYVLMVSSMHPPFLRLSDEDIAALNETPFDGVAVDILGQYDGSPVPGESALLEHCRHVRGLSQKPIWPRVYLNRVQEVAADRKHVCRNPPYFTAIKGWDLYEESGALRDFYQLWRLSLRMARSLGAPGIVFDAESYNHSQSERVQWIAERQGKTPEEIVSQLRAIGARLADISGEEFPEAILWSLFTTLGQTEPAHREAAGNYFIACRYIFSGLLDRAAERRIPVLLISGGEWGGYYYPSVDAMRKRFAVRNAGFKPWLEKYPANLALGATITVWGDARNNSGWVLDSATADTPYRGVPDFEPLVQEMFRTYRYVWFYVPAVTDYKPLDAQKSRETNRQIAELLRRARPSHRRER